MKKFIGIIVALLVLAPLPAMASGVPGIAATSTPNTVCSLANGNQYGEVWGCIDYSSNIIYINSSLPSSLFEYAIAHELGNYYLQGVSSSTLQQVINPYPSLESEVTLGYLAANQFALWLYNQSAVSAAENTLFTSLLLSK